MTEQRRSSNGRSRPPRRRGEPPELAELRLEVRELRRGNTRPSARARRGNGRSSTRPRRRRLFLGLAAVVVTIVVIFDATSAGTRSFAMPSRSSLDAMSLGQRIVAIANSQLGYSADPPHSYCNKFSAYWGVGAATCPGGESAEEWCADFAAWAWQKAGVPFSYGFGLGDINAAAASFYAWGVDHGRWHPAYSGYVPAPGDVAVYGLSLGTSPSAAHVAIVTGTASGQRGPDVINGDGDHTGFSVVETGTDQLRADAGHGVSAPLTGYVTPD